MVRLPYTAGGISFVVAEPAIIAAPLLNVLSGLAVVGMSSTQVFRCQHSSVEAEMVLQGRSREQKGRSTPGICLATLLQS